MQHKENIEVLIAVISGSLFILLFALAVFLLFRIFLKKKNRLMIEQERMKHNFRQELLHAQIEIQEQTLKNISQEIHDNIGQTLSLAKLNLNTIHDKKNEVVDGKIENTKELVSKAIIDLRHLSKSLNTDSILSAGLLKAIEHELTQVQKTGSFITSLQIEGNPFRLDPQKELILFRIVQEGINNIIKHSAARTIGVRMIFQPGLMELQLSDDGNGFKHSETDSDMNSGSGLRNMKSRAVMIGGLLEIVQNKPTGTIIKVILPNTES